MEAVVVGTGYRPSPVAEPLCTLVRPHGFIVSATDIRISTSDLHTEMLRPRVSPKKSIIIVYYLEKAEYRTELIRFVIFDFLVILELQALVLFLGCRKSREHC